MLITITIAPPACEYIATSNYHGVDVPLYTPITVTARTNDPDVVEITFRWHEPPDGNGPTRWEETVPISSDDDVHPLAPALTSPDGEDLPYYAESTHAPDVLGDWGVQVFFQGPDGTDKSGVENVVKIRATSFNTTPEIPLGTIGASTVMLIAIAFFLIRQKKLTGPRLNT